MNTRQMDVDQPAMPFRPSSAGKAEEPYPPIDVGAQIEAQLKTQRAWILAIATPIVLGSLIGLAVLWYDYYSAENRYRDQMLVSEKYKRELAASKTEIEKFRSSTETLLNNTIPGLLPFQYNKSLQIDKKYVKRIAFDESSSKAGSRAAFQCRINLVNDGDSTVLPEIVVVFFNQAGFVVDYLHLGNLADARMKSAALKPNEKRTDISPVIEIPDSTEKPAYFVVNVK